jgi:uncharacterized membrane protein YfcA
MTTLGFTILVALLSFAAGLLGALTGLGGGVVLVPALALLFHVDIRYAIGASLVSVIATSSGAAAAYVREGYSNIRIGMFLEIATTIGALVGAFLATRVTTPTIAILFGATLLYSASIISKQAKNKTCLAPRRACHATQAQWRFSRPTFEIRYCVRMCLWAFARSAGRFPDSWGSVPP